MAPPENRTPYPYFDLNLDHRWCGQGGLGEVFFVQPHILREKRCSGFLVRGRHNKESRPVRASSCQFVLHTGAAGRQSSQALSLRLDREGDEGRKVKDSGVGLTDGVDVDVPSCKSSL